MIRNPNAPLTLDTSHPRTGRPPGLEPLFGGRCFAHVGDETVALAGEPDPKALLGATAVDAAIRAFIGSPRFPCVGAKSAVNRDAYRFGLYEDLREADDAHALAGHLARFAREVDDVRGDGGFATFMAVFLRPDVRDEAHFEQLLWAQLRRLHQVDRERHGWDPAVSSNPDDPHFSFSIGGRAFFVVGLHPGASRAARRFCWPTLVFNPHDQFERLRQEQRMNKMQRVIRDRDVALQGDLNPNLADHGEATEARQYSGRPAEEAWRPPVPLAGPLAGPLVRDDGHAGHVKLRQTPEKVAPPTAHVDRNASRLLPEEQPPSPPRSGRCPFGFGG